MPQTCCAFGCTNRQARASTKSFFRIPTEKNQREKWVAAINRKEWSPTEYSRLCSDHFVTGKPSKIPSHPDYAPSIFVFSQQSSSPKLSRHVRAERRRKRQREADSEKQLSAKQYRQSCNSSSDLNESNNVGELSCEPQETYELEDTPEPSIALCDEPQETAESNDTVDEHSEELLSNVGELSCETYDTPEPSIALCDEPQETAESNDTVDEHSEELLSEPQTDDICEPHCELTETLESLKAEVEETKEAVLNLRSQLTASEITRDSVCQDNQYLQIQLNQLRQENEFLVRTAKWNGFSVSNIENDDAKTCFYTGLPTYLLFDTVFGLLKDHAKGRENNEYRLKDEFFAVVVRLRLNIPARYLAYRFDITESMFSRIFHKWLDVMFQHMRHLVRWPDAETLRRNLPAVFKKHYEKVRCIIDCFEIFIERPVSFSARALTFSNYKKHNTVKVLIAVSPTGSIVFISNAWGGRVSDKQITQECGFLNLIEPGDVVLADRGFNVSDDLALRQAKLEIPAFTRGKTQLPQREVETSRQLARVRIHVERVIGQLRKKYKILQGTLPVSLVKRPTDAVPTIDKVLAVTAALTNLCDPVL